MSSEVEKLVPHNISDVGLIDDDSGLRLFRGMITPWDQIKSFKETYNFLIRHAAMVKAGDTNNFPLRDSSDEIGHLSRVLNEMSSAVKDREQKLMQTQSNLKEAQHIAKIGSWERNHRPM